ncbi:MARVEL domain-containing protein [Caerostris darwini]|uniref:MARVEL domain-containing protein n=1 Tax=Caerostris darwini TaxID=1538125 RepID=A0AAV4UXJ7_9ARAC|nr:MARVEL domain-containing protein [Caerostris darwini]
MTDPSGWNISCELNFSFVRSINGILKSCHVVLGLIAFILILSYSPAKYLDGTYAGIACTKSAAFFLLVSYSFLVISFLVFFCSLLSYHTASTLPKTAFELTYHVIACFMYIIASLTLMIVLIKDNQNPLSQLIKDPGYNGKVAASVFGVMNSIVYGISIFLTIRSR